MLFVFVVVRVCVSVLRKCVFSCACACSLTKEVCKVAGTADPRLCLQTLIVVSDEEQLDRAATLKMSIGFYSIGDIR